MMDYIRHLAQNPSEFDELPGEERLRLCHYYIIEVGLRKLELRVARHEKAYYIKEHKDKAKTKEEKEKISEYEKFLRETELYAADDEWERGNEILRGKKPNETK